MEIVYCYIKEYKNLKSINLNFGCEFVFRFEEKTKKLNVRKNDLFIPNFYNSKKYGTDILSVTSIIGENGSGKTSILNFLKDNFAKGSALFSDVVFIIKSDSVFTVYSTFPDVQFNDAHRFKLNFIPKNSNNTEEIDFGFDFRGFENLDIIYLSNIFDGSGGRNVQGLYDISTNHLVQYDHQKLFEQKIIDQRENNLKAFAAEELFRQLKFINSEYSKEKLLFNLPDLLSIEPYERNFWISINEDETYGVITKRILEEFKFDYSNKNKQPDFKGVNSLITASIINLIREIYDHPISEGDKAKLKENLSFIENNSLVRYEGYDQLIQYLQESLESWFSENQSNLSAQVTKVKDNTLTFIRFLNENKDKFQNSYLNSSQQGQPAALINISKNEVLIKQFLQLYLQTFPVNQYLKFSWQGLSSGENALLNIYSRLFSLSDSQKFGNHLAKDLLILIDEGDTYLHPSWQKDLLRSLLDILPSIFHSSFGNRRIQVIFTTNSPIPASDFLNYNTVFLKRKRIGRKYETVVIESLEDQHETFAANIQSLLSNSFFVDNGLIGNFAKEKINDLIQNIKSLGDISSEERERMRKLIHQIGEPVVKKKLQQMYNDRFNLDIHERLENLEKRMGKL